MIRNAIRAAGVLLATLAIPAGIFAASPPASASGASNAMTVSASAPAAALVPQARGPILCAGDVCVQSSCATCNIQNIYAWANRTTFTGHFELCSGFNGNGGCFVQNSPNRKWPAGGTHWTFPGLSGATDACATAWKSVSGGYQNIGQECFTLA
jgi:hypothetical protein